MLVLPLRNPPTSPPNQTALPSFFRGGGRRTSHSVATRRALAVMMIRSAWGLTSDRTAIPAGVPTTAPLSEQPGAPGPKAAAALDEDPDAQEPSEKERQEDDLLSIAR